MWYGVVVASYYTKSFPKLTNYSFKSCPICDKKNREKKRFLIVKLYHKWLYNVDTQPGKPLRLVNTVCAFMLTLAVSLLISLFLFTHTHTHTHLPHPPHKHFPDSAALQLPCPVGISNRVQTVHFMSQLCTLQLLVPHYWGCCQSKESDDRLPTCQAPVECLSDWERRGWMNWNPPTWCREREFSALRLLVRSGFNLSCLVCAADQYQLYYKWSGAKPMCTVSTCT